MKVNSVQHTQAHSMAQHTPSVYLKKFYASTIGVTGHIFI